MSNGLHQVAPASFFPTAKELSSGLQWFKDHPILAAAAATAVSVITYLNTADEMGDDTVELDIATGRGGAVGKHVDGADDYERAPRRRRDSDPTASSSSSASAACPKPTITRQLSAGSRVTPPALRKPGSDGRISSPAAVSWVDEHGGELTQVFEHLTVDDDEREHSRFPDLDGPPRAPRRHFFRKPSRLNGGAESPQWGWYVAITPPQDQHSCHANLPRAVPQPPSRLPCGGDLKPTRSPTGIADRPNASAPTHGACGAGDPTPPAIAAAQSTSTAMRRSTSGRIQG
ncbi:hypothetical protein P43SY_002603 [Pythium insidiosum]|uniref:Uncharacterized protein n=1 Tax=Pythium insidiosum TaxID=114742 RepID=A0AAD5MA65_PYTIN|nr:hypothetical protein P43SY_002603 [Pythium insidiosum]